VHPQKLHQHDEEADKERHAEDGQERLQDKRVYAFDSEHGAKIGVFG
jgi:hypothetical protein